MKIIFFGIVLLLLGSQLQAQDYVDIIRMSSNNTTLGNVENDYKTDVFNQQVQLYYPIRASKNLVFITGFTFENTNLNLLSGSSRSENLIMGRLNLGIKYTHSKKLKATYLLLPKVASNFNQIGLQDFQFGGLALWGYQVSELWKIKFGVYVSSENHGSTVTPLLGVWYRSRNKKFFINAVLPIRADINYTIVGNFSVGADLLTSVKAYDLASREQALYVQEESIRVGAYLSYAFLDKALLLRLRAGFDTTEYGLYDSGDIIGAQVLTFPVQGDNRNRLNPEMNAGFYFGGDLIYRFDLSKEKK
jgi:hypothetical protein